MITTDSEETANACRSLRNHGRPVSGSAMEHNRIGYNYRMSDINCALGVSQLEKMDTILEKRRGVAEKFRGKVRVRALRRARFMGR